MYDNRQHTRPARVSVRARIRKTAIDVVSENVTNGMDFDPAVNNAAAQLSVIAYHQGLDALRVGAVVRGFVREVCS